MKRSRPYKRKILNLSVNRDLQFRMIGRITGILFLSLLISSALYYLYADQQITSSFRLFHIKARNFLDFLLPMVVGSFLISLAIGTVASLFLPKKIAGGLYRIEQELKEVIDGDLTVRIVLRQGDDVTALAGQLNQLIGELHNRFARQRQELLEAERLCSSGAGDPAERLAQLQQKIEKALRELDDLKLSD